MKKIAIAVTDGGFSLSNEVVQEVISLKGLSVSTQTDSHGNCTYSCDGAIWAPDFERDDPDLIAAIEKFGCEKASGYGALLGIVEIPEGIPWSVCTEEYCGEYISEKHREWYINPRTGVTNQIRG